jgi:DNA-binding LytR/AlgR family response regulator
VKVVTLNSEYISKISTTEIESLLPKTKFIRIHRSYIVSINKIETYNKTEVGIKGKIIPVGKAFRNEVLFK